VEQPTPITNAFTSADNCRKGNMFLDSRLFDGADNKKKKKIPGGRTAERSKRESEITGQINRRTSR
jgi:hypothetical protein